ncbi:MAG: Trehalose/maltose import ATP-binding protein MalK [Methanomassiliicoccales archaeon PtaU1.Bin124]|nr:MAG: Trehalose/maltose import ATP-binding protein MalK [Methanomassiliicoccales archaeon PtaU1.Bin124]
MPEVVLRGVSKKYGKVVAVDDISLTIKDGEYVTILGPSGCGKTTLIRMIAGIIQPTEGQVFIGGKDMKGVEIEDRDLGYVFQNIALFPNLNVADNVAYSPRVKDRPAEEQAATAKKYLELVKLLDRMSMLPGELCGGEQQKVSLARALATGSKLLLLDEPLSALDARVRMDLRYDLRRLVKQLGITTVHVTHDQEEAMSVSDRIVLMRKGSVMEMGSPEQLYTKPQNMFTANFIGETNFFEGWVKERADGLSKIELRDGSEMSVANCPFDKGTAIVVSVRPEFVFPFTSGLHAKITSITYMGTYWRISTEADSEDEVELDVPVADGSLYKIGQEVYLMVNRKAAIVFPRPREGIAEAISLE